MAYKRKYRQGARVKSIEEFLRSSETQYFWWHGRTVHKQVFLHWQVDTLIKVIGGGCLYFAVENVLPEGGTK